MKLETILSILLILASFFGPIVAVLLSYYLLGHP